MRARWAALLALGVAAAAWPATASAHGLVQRANLPIPEWLFGWGAAIVLVVSFLALAALWPRPKLEGSDTWRELPLGAGRLLGSRAVEIACGVIGAALLGIVLWAGFAGRQSAQDNLAPTFVFITFWVGLAFVSALFGDVFRAFNPWRALGRAGGWVVTRARGRPAEHRPYPARLGHWPAAAGLLAFTWMELASNVSDEPRAVAIAASVYSVLTFAAMATYGVETWSARGEAFSVYFNLFSRISPFQTRDRVVGVRPVLAGLTRLERLPGTVGVVAVMIGTVTFDGMAQGKVWVDVAQRVTDAFEWLGLSEEPVERLTSTVGLVLCVALVAAFYFLGTLGARSVGGDHSAERLRRGFVHALVPIALVYVIAHYLTFLLFEGQEIFALASNPLGRGWDLFGTASTAVDYGLITQNQTWYAQVAFVVAGHVAALVLAHDRALVLYRQAKLAVRSQYWMLAIMVGFTTLALWLLAQAGTAVTAGESSKPKSGTYRLVDFTKRPPFVNALEIDPRTKDFLLTTNRGFWRIDAEARNVTRVPATIAVRGKRDTLGTFLLIKSIGSGRLIGSGHPDTSRDLPQFLGVLRSDDDGRTWKVVSRFGNADLHKIVEAHGRIYAFDAVLSALLVSDDEGRTFTEHFTPRGLIIDFEVDPADPDYVLATTDDQLFRSEDRGEHWRRLLAARGVRLVWTAPRKLYRADADGSVFKSQDRGETWEEVGSVEGEPYKFKAVGEDELYLALSDGTIVHTTDGGQDWKVTFKP